MKLSFKEEMVISELQAGGTLSSYTQPVKHILSSKSDPNGISIYMKTIKDLECKGILYRAENSIHRNDRSFHWLTPFGEQIQLNENKKG